MYMKKPNVNILIVDDSRDNLAVLEDSLENDSCNIFTTSSPKEVIDICTQKDIDIALIDIKMPDINGFELLEMIKKKPINQADHGYPYHRIFHAP